MGPKTLFYFLRPLLFLGSASELKLALLGLRLCSLGTGSRTGVLDLELLALSAMFGLWKFQNITNPTRNNILLHIATSQSGTLVL